MAKPKARTMPVPLSIRTTSTSNVRTMPPPGVRMTPMSSNCTMPVPSVNASGATPGPPLFSTTVDPVPPTENVAWARVELGFRARGWTEHVLPDRSVYYANAALRVVTNIDLRNNKKFEAVRNALERKGSGEPALAPPPEGWQLWLREGAATLSYDPPLFKAWVNHKARILTLHALPPVAEAIERISEEDSEYCTYIIFTVTDWFQGLDMEYRYWTFMESHPAHASLPENASTEAMDTLTWCHTGELYAPEVKSYPTGCSCRLSPSITTRYSATIHIPRVPRARGPSSDLVWRLSQQQDCSYAHRRQRVRPPRYIHLQHLVFPLLSIFTAQWRQRYFRPNRPLPSDANKGLKAPESRMFFRRVFMDLILSVFCLGIPYFSTRRRRYYRVDEETSMRSQDLIPFIGACVCFVVSHNHSLPPGKRYLIFGLV